MHIVRVAFKAEPLHGAWRVPPEQSRVVLPHIAHLPTPLPQLGWARPDDDQGALANIAEGIRAHLDPDGGARIPDVQEDAEPFKYENDRPA